ncbi:MAG: sulfite exporter TauE/SafE family protein [Thermodesulfobacteriota bacterium]
MIDYVFFFIAGIAGSFHCIGMCGGFPIALASVSNQSPSRKVLNQLLYNSGRIFTYTFLGAVLGYLSLMINEIKPILNAQVVVSIVAGVFMILVGLQILGILGERAIPGYTPIYIFIKKAIASFIGYKSLAAPLYLGIFNGFLPCPLIYAFLFKATTSGAPDKGAMTMLSLGLGTIPTMFLVGSLSGIISPRIRAKVSLIPGLVVVIFGIITIARALIPLYFIEYHQVHFYH